MHQNALTTLALPGHDGEFIAIPGSQLLTELGEPAWRAQRKEIKKEVDEGDKKDGKIDYQSEILRILIESITFKNGCTVQCAPLHIKTATKVTLCDLVLLTFNVFSIQHFSYLII